MIERIRNYFMQQSEFYPICLLISSLINVYCFSLKKWNLMSVVQSSSLIICSHIMLVFLDQHTVETFLEKTCNVRDIFLQLISLDLK